MTDWTLTDFDRELFQRELNSFVPPVLFDAHAHWYRADHFPPEARPGLVASGPPVAGGEAFDREMEKITPGRKTEGLFFPYPHAQVDVDAENEFLFEELKRRPGSRGQMLITPQQDPEFLRETVRRCGFVGLKCYHVYSSRRPTFDSLIEEYLPEPQVAVAHDEGLSITLHMVRSRALADRANQETIRRYCERYPNMRLILAHAARGFNVHHTIEGIESLRGLGNVWFDTSAVTDSGAIEAILRVFGPSRVLYGSDFPVSHLRGRCISLGDSFLWISAANTQLDVPYGRIELALVGHESLRTLKVAAMSTGLSDAEVEAIFLTNGRQLYSLL
ncbi:amidohydrolase family protein [Planctomyces sp. SH-PL14]|uniref:amidohydrolase family protein n=1 Tax=Planctomyces sp. SH-PL14 TaxID=1632864 RepID=UPI00078EA634|nr:amidohydrolase family protein [Planctomyces sp. SH-PL14]AMV20863.1 Amidohydrolase [Planctomyces sp. SH-PL14]